MRIGVGLDTPENLPVAWLTADATRRSLTGGCGWEQARFLERKGDVVLLRPWINRVMRHMPPEVQIKWLLRFRGCSHVRNAPVTDVVTHVRGPPRVWAVLPRRNCFRSHLILCRWRGARAVAVHWRTVGAGVIEAVLGWVRRVCAVG